MSTYSGFRTNFLICHRLWRYLSFDTFGRNILHLAFNVHFTRHRVLLFFFGFLAKLRASQQTSSIFLTSPSTQKFIWSLSLILNIKPRSKESYGKCLSDLLTVMHLRHSYGHVEGILFAEFILSTNILFSWLTVYSKSLIEAQRII